MLQIINILVLFLVINLLGYIHGRKVSQPKNNLGVVGGEPAKIEDFPYIVSIEGNGGFICGGSIIHERFILTAGHCAIFLDMYSKAVVQVGASVYSHGTAYEVKDKYVNENFDMFENEHDYDIALLKLKTPLVFGDSVKIGKFIDPDRTFDDNTQFNVTGWGSVKYEGRISSELRRSLVPFVNEETCKKDYSQLHRQEITDRVICAGSAGHAACQGDSGGPLTYQGKIVGVVSGGEFCALAEYPTIYSKVSSFTDWIATTIEKNSS